MVSRLLKVGGIGFQKVGIFQWHFQMINNLKKLFRFDI